MKKLKFIEEPKEGRNLKKLMFPQLFNLSSNELNKVKGGYTDPCDAVCLPSEWGGPCTCYDNVC